MKGIACLNYFMCTGFATPKERMCPSHLSMGKEWMKEAGTKQTSEFQPAASIVGGKDAT